MATPLLEFVEALKRRAPEFGIELSPEQSRQLANYYDLVGKWNPRLHLVGPCSPDEFASRHVLESLTLLKHLPSNSSIIDVGSGAGLPAVPCLLVRRDLRGTLIESSQKKGVFLNEALRAVEPAGRVDLLVARFEDVSPPEADFVTCRALDRFGELLPQLIEWAPPDATFALFAGESLRDQGTSLLKPIQIERIPQSNKRFLVIARRG